MIPKGASIPYLVLATFVSAAGTWAVRRYAGRSGIVAIPGHRSLHSSPTPRGGGIAIAAAFLLVATAIWLTWGVPTGMALGLGAGGAAAAILGFIDDRHEIAQRFKLAIYMALSAWALVAAGAKPLAGVAFVPDPVMLLLSWIALVWLINLYNFIDGIDGMAASAAVGICALLCVALWGVDRNLVVVVALLGAASLGFLVFNWPPASIFMGDAGSLFLGFAFAALLAWTVTRGAVSIWTWLCILGYHASDTTTTTALRMLRTRRFWEGHRSHAYQNLARILASHRIVVSGVILYQVLWLLPLTIWSVRRPETAPLAAALAVAPAVLWTLRFGPRLSAT